MMPEILTVSFSWLEIHFCQLLFKRPCTDTKQYD